MIDLTIIILSYKSKPDLERLLPSVFASKGVTFNPHPRLPAPEGAANGGQADPLPKGEGEGYAVEVIVVDNDSRDGTLEWLKTTGYRLTTIANANTGFASGNNVGIKSASGKYILLLNPDTKLEPDTLQTMLEFMEKNQQVGICGCKVIKADGSLDLACRRRFPNPWNSLFRILGISKRDYNMLDTDENQSQEIDSVMGAFLLIRKSLVDKIGLLDERFFMYGEDIDWCWRCKEAGMKVWYYPKTFITHYKGSSSAQVPFKALLWFHQAMWIFYQKHYAEKYFFLFNWLVFLGVYFRLGLLIFVNIFRSKPIVSK